MHLTDLITPEDLYKEMSKIAPTDVTERARAAEHCREEVKPYIKAVQMMASQIPPPMSLMMIAGAMTVLQSMEKVLQRKIGNAN